MPRKTIKKLVKDLNKSTLEVKRVGNKFRVRDVVEFDGDFGLMSEKELRRRFG